jgi:putative CocE/NonD family hydrolase
VLGPWNHGGWGFLKGDRLGRIGFDSATAEYFRKNIQARWFAWYLKGKGDSSFAKVTTFQTGSNRWMRYDSWPPRAALIKNLYFNSGRKLSFTPPADQLPTFDSYRSDPANPVPYRTRPIEETYGPGSRWYTWLTEDQRFVQDRPDVLAFSTDALDEDLTITGTITAKLYAATSGSDADWVVKLIDVYPDHYPKEPALAGYELMVAGDVFRARFRKSFEHPEPLSPEKVEEYAIDLHTQDHVFKKGHRIMVQVQSTWFPIIDRNPQTYVPNIFEAKEKDFQPAMQKIYRSADRASCILLPVID